MFAGLFRCSGHGPPITVAMRCEHSERRITFTQGGKIVGEMFYHGCSALTCRTLARCFANLLVDVEPHLDAALDGAFPAALLKLPHVYA